MGRTEGKVERWGFAAVVFVGRTVVRGVSCVPRIVSRASGIAQPSAPATIAGVVGASVALARLPLGPIAGACVDLGGTAAVLAIATWSVPASTGVDAFAVVLAALLGDADRRLPSALLPTVARRHVSRVLARTLGDAAAPLRAWSAMASAARLVHVVEQLVALERAGAPTDALDAPDAPSRAAA